MKPGYFLVAGGLLSCSALLSFLSWRTYVRGNRMAIIEKEVVKPPVVKRGRMNFGKALDLLYSSDSLADRCDVLEIDVLTLTFHNDASAALQNNERLMNFLLDCFANQLDHSKRSSLEEKEARLCGWILANMSFVHSARSSLPSVLCGKQQTSLFVLLCSFIKILSSKDDLYVDQMFDVKAPIQSVLTSSLQMFVNFSVLDENVERMSAGSLIGDLCTLVVMDVQSELVVQILKILVNISITLRDNPDISSTSRLKAMCAHLAKANKDETIQLRLASIQMNLISQK